MLALLPKRHGCLRLEKMLSSTRQWPSVSRLRVEELRLVSTTSRCGLQKKSDSHFAAGIWTYHNRANREARYRRRDGLAQAAENPDLVLCHEFDHATSMVVVFRALFAGLAALPFYVYLHTDEVWHLLSEELDKTLPWEQVMFCLVTIPIVTAVALTPWCINRMMLRIYYEHQRDLFVGVKTNFFNPFKTSGRVFEMPPKDLVPVKIGDMEVLFKSKSSGHLFFLRTEQITKPFYVTKLIDH